MRPVDGWDVPGVVACDNDAMRSRNWLWGWVALVVWAAIFFAFLLIAIPRH
jgi:hypothetical protein